MREEAWAKLYKILKRLDGIVGFCYFYLAFVGVIVAGCAPYTEATTWQFICRMAAAALLFLGPLFAHYNGLLLINNRVFSVIGSLISGVAVLAVTWIAPFDAALNTLPLPWLYRPLVLVMAVIIPFVLWLLMLLAYWRGRSELPLEFFY